MEQILIELQQEPASKLALPSAAKKPEPLKPTRSSSKLSLEDINRTFEDLQNDFNGTFNENTTKETEKLAQEIFDWMKQAGQISASAPALKLKRPASSGNIRAEDSKRPNINPHMK